jgi:hypothetical protein
MYIYSLQIKWGFKKLYDYGTNIKQEILQMAQTLYLFLCLSSPLSCAHACAAYTYIHIIPCLAPSIWASEDQ